MCLSEYIFFSITGSQQNLQSDAVVHKNKNFVHLQDHFKKRTPHLSSETLHGKARKGFGNIFSSFLLFLLGCPVSSWPACTEQHLASGSCELVLSVLFWRDSCKGLRL